MSTLNRRPGQFKKLGKVFIQRSGGAVGALNPLDFERRRKVAEDLHRDSERPYQYESNTRLVWWIILAMVLWVCLSFAAAITELAQIDTLTRWKYNGFNTLPPKFGSNLGKPEVDSLFQFAADNGLNCASIRQFTSEPHTSDCEVVFSYTTELNRAEDNSSIVFAGILFVFVISSFLVASFAYQSNRNLLPLKTKEQRFSSTSAAAWLFVFGFGFYRGSQIFTEIWKGSDPEISKSNWKESRGSFLIPLWWLLFTAVITIWLLRAIGMFNSETIDEKIVALGGVLLVADLLLILPATLCAIVVWGIHRRQQRRFNVVGLYLARPDVHVGTPGS